MRGRETCDQCGGEGCWNCSFIGSFPPKPTEFPEETEALTDQRTIDKFMTRYDEAAEAHFEHQNNNEERRYK